MVHIPENNRPMTDAQFNAWWEGLSPEKKEEWLEYSRKHLVKR